MNTLNWKPWALGLGVLVILSIVGGLFGKAAYEKKVSVLLKENTDLKSEAITYQKNIKTMTDTNQSLNQSLKKWMTKKTYFPNGHVKAEISSGEENATQFFNTIAERDEIIENQKNEIFSLKTDLLKKVDTSVEKRFPFSLGPSASFHAGSLTPHFGLTGSLQSGIVVPFFELPLTANLNFEPDLKF